MTTETTRALHELKLPGMAKSWEALNETHQLDKLSLRDGFALLLQAERDNRHEAQCTHEAAGRYRTSRD